MATQTSVARVSLAGGSTPATATDHQILVTARTTAGAGTIRAALYEGANNRSGDLESTGLTTSLADYTLAISDAAAATITDYSNLEIRFWGYAPGSALGEHSRLSGPTVLTGSAVTQFTGASGGSRIETISVSNPSASPVDLTLSIGADAAGTRYYDDYAIPADTEVSYNLYLPINADEPVQAFAGTAGVLVLTISGTAYSSASVTFEVDKICLEIPAA